MTPDLIRKMPRDEAIAAARLYELHDLAEEIEAKPRRWTKMNIFELAREASFSLTDLATAANVPRSTVTAASNGKIKGGTSHWERQRIARYLKQRRAVIDEAIAMCERK